LVSIGLVLSEEKIFEKVDKEKGQEYWRVYLTYDNSHIVGR
jgi:hypothetical protein